MAVVQSAFYAGAKLLIVRRPKIEAPGKIDGKIPFVPAAVVPYISSYAFWVLAFGAMALVDLPRYGQLMAAELLGCAICFVIFLAVPTQITPPPAPSGFFGFCIRTMRRIDHPLVNLFPSLHCMASWLCVFAALGHCPLWWQVASLLWTLAIVWSTVAVKQHYFADTVAGLVVAAVAWGVCTRLPVLSAAMAALAENIWALAGL